MGEVVKTGVKKLNPERRGGAPHPSGTDSQKARWISRRPSGADMSAETVRYTMRTAAVQDGIWMRAKCLVHADCCAAGKMLFPVRPEGGPENQDGGC